jgi:hypothetical protein
LRGYKRLGHFARVPGQVVESTSKPWGITSLVRHAIIPS